MWVTLNIELNLDSLNINNQQNPRCRCPCTSSSITLSYNLRKVPILIQEFNRMNFINTWRHYCEYIWQIFWKFLIEMLLRSEVWLCYFVYIRQWYVEFISNLNSMLSRPRFLHEVFYWVLEQQKLLSAT